MLRTTYRLRYSPKEAADFAEVSVWTIRKAIWRGDFPVTYINARVLRIDRADLMSWVEARRHTGRRKQLTTTPHNSANKSRA